MKPVKAALCIVLAVLFFCTAPFCAFAGGHVSVGVINTNGALVCNKSFDTLITRLNKGTHVLYWKCGVKNLVKVVTQKGVVGFCYDGYVDHDRDVDKSNIRKTSGNDLVVYGMRNGKLVKKCGVTTGMPLIVTDTKNGYAKLKNLKGQVGYMKLSDLKKVW